MKEQAYQVMESLRLPSGLYLASLSDAYQYVWVRDTCYIALANLYDTSNKYETSFHALLDIFRKYQWKIDYHTRHRPNEVFEYIHPRYTATTFEEVKAPWGNAQNDAIGLFLYCIGRGLKQGKPMLRDERDREVVSQLIRYLGVLEYWQDEDNGIWEENRELHASSIGACVAGLRELTPFFEVDEGVIEHGVEALEKLLPRESPTKAVDMALLSLIYPYQVVSTEMASQLVQRVEERLKRSHGVIRYEGDQYYNDEGLEAEWCFGFPWLGLCHAVLGNTEAATHYLNETERIMFAPGVLPELYLGKSLRPNANTPLAWANSMYVQLCDWMKRMAD